MQMALESKVRLLFHSWASMPIVEGKTVKGIVFESKEGRQAVLAKVVIDTTGDADLIARTGAAMQSDIDEGDIHHCINTAFMIGGVDMERWLAFRRDDPKGFADLMTLGRDKIKFFEKPFVSWRNDVALFMGPRLSGYSAVDVDDLTAVEIRSRQLTVGHLEIYRQHAPGFANAFLMLGAPQIGVRHSRRLSGLNRVTRAQWDAGTVWPDEIGVSTSLSPKFANISVPYGALIPAGLDNILGAGRHVACDASSHTFLREVPQASPALWRPMRARRRERSMPKKSKTSCCGRAPIFLRPSRRRCSRSRRRSRAGVQEAYRVNAISTLALVHTSQRSPLDSFLSSRSVSRNRPCFCRSESAALAASASSDLAGGLMDGALAVGAGNTRRNFEGAAAVSRSKRNSPVWP
jgi:FAD dependent oxidoreductase